MIAPIIRGLAERGHNITSVTYFPQKTSVKNIHDIDVSSIHPIFTNKAPVDYALQNWRPIRKVVAFAHQISIQNCEAVLQLKQVQQLLQNDDNKFDLIVSEVFGSDCFLAFAYKYNASIVSITSSVAMPWLLDLIGIPINPSYISSFFSPVSNTRTLYDRMYNTIITAMEYIGYKYYNPHSHAMLQKYFGESLPSLQDIRKGRSLVLANTHHSFRHIQPAVPNYIEIAGIHLQEPKPLPKDLQELLDKSINGAILVSLGSVIRCSTLPQEKLDAFLKSFEKLPYQILWKVEDSLQGLSQNVLTRKWFPIQDILDHPNLKLMIMHGGMSTTIEVVNAGVPVVGIPLFGDQFSNIDALVKRGGAIGIDYIDLTQELLYDAIVKVSTDPSYKENMKKVSSLFKDRQNTPTETTMFWIEHLIRHKGASHLESPAAHMPWYQIMLLDIILLFIIVSLLVTYVLYLIVKTVRSFLLKPKKKKTA